MPTARCARRAASEASERGPYSFGTRCADRRRLPRGRQNQGFTMKSLAGKPVRILFVEDDVGHHALIHSWLKSEGYHIDAFHSGLDAKQFLSEQWADLANLDWDLPGVSGDK